MLKPGSEIIKYPFQRIFLFPVNGLQPELNGRWEVVASTRSGNDKSVPRVELVKVSNLDENLGSGNNDHPNGKRS